MYHIGSDKRQIQSAGLICEALERLLQKKPYQAITITQLAEEAGVGRATFYRLFDDKADVMLYQIEQVFNELVALLGPDSGSSLVLTTLFEGWLRQKALFLALIEAGLYEVFQTRLSVIVEEKLAFVREERGVDSRSWRYFVHIRAGMLFAALRVAITQYPNDTADDIIATMNRLFGTGHAIAPDGKD